MLDKMALVIDRSALAKVLKDWSEEEARIENVRLERRRAQIRKSAAKRRRKLSVDEQRAERQRDALRKRERRRRLSEDGHERQKALHASQERERLLKMTGDEKASHRDERASKRRQSRQTKRAADGHVDAGADRRQALSASVAAAVEDSKAADTTELPTAAVEDSKAADTTERPTAVIEDSKAADTTERATAVEDSRAADATECDKQEAAIASDTMLTRERSERQAARDANMKLARIRHENVELFMECDEEELSPAQIAAHKKAVGEYQEALKKIAAVKAAQATTTVVSNNVSAGTEMSNSAPQAQLLIQQQPSEPLIGIPRVAFPANQPQQPQYIIQNTMPVTSIQTPTAGYKLLFDTRTGLILGTMPNESPAVIATTGANQQPVVGNQNPALTFVPQQGAESGAITSLRIVEASKTYARPQVTQLGNLTSVDKSRQNSSVAPPLGHQIIQIIKTTNNNATSPPTVASNNAAAAAANQSVLKPVASLSQPAAPLPQPPAASLSEPTYIDLSGSDNVPNAEQATNNKPGPHGEYPSLAVKVVPQRLAPFSVIQNKQAHLDKVLKEILNQTLTGLVRWLFEHGMFQLHQLCVVHKQEEMVLVFNQKNESDTSGGYRWECSSCKYTVPAQHGSFFDNVNHNFYSMLKVIYHWSCNSDLTKILLDTKVEPNFLRSVFSLLRSVCAKKVKELIQLGGSDKRPLELAVTKILKPKAMTPLYLACIYERLSGLVALQVFEGDLRLDLFLEVYVLPHSTISVDGLPQIPPQLQKLQHYNVVASPRGSSDLVLNAMAYIQERVIPMFRSVSFSQLRIEVIQSFLSELMWREKYGTNPYNTFNNILLHLKQHYRTGLGLVAPPNEPVPMPIVTALNNLNKKIDVAAAVLPPPPPPTPAPRPPPAYARPPPPPYARPPPLIALPAPASAAVAPKEPEARAGRTILLDDYYYGWQDGSVNTKNDKILSVEKFRCHPCKKLFDNNIKLMRHMHGHIESSKQMNMDLSDLTQCKHCFREFETPYSMQCHVEAVHSKDSTPLMCRICDHAFKDDMVLINHMYMMHTASEMPYVCKVCNYRCSMYQSVIKHFHQEHSGTSYVQCHYCLQVFNIKFSSFQNHGISSPFWMHLYKHQAKSLMRKCPACCLMFFSNFDAKQHRQLDHVSFKNAPNTRHFTVDPAKSIYMNMPTKDREAPVRMRAYKRYSVFNSEGQGKGKYPKLLFRTEPGVLEGMHCLECKSEMEGPEHFLGFVCCSRCNYATYCGKAYANHMIFRHADGPRKDDCSWPVYLPKTMYCVCGFAHQRGNLMAYHLVQCNKKSCYPSVKAARNATVGGSDTDSADEAPVNMLAINSSLESNARVDLPELADETSQHQDENPNMLNILGLMRKPDQKPPPSVPKISGEDSNTSIASPCSEADKAVDAKTTTASADVETRNANSTPDDDSQIEAGPGLATSEMEFNQPTMPEVFPSAMVGDQVKPSKNAVVPVRNLSKKKRRRKGTVTEWTHRKGTKMRTKLTAAEDDDDETEQSPELEKIEETTDSSAIENCEARMSCSDRSDTESAPDSSPDVLTEEKPTLVSCEKDASGPVEGDDDDEALPPILDCYADSDNVK